MHSKEKDEESINRDENDKIVKEQIEKSIKNKYKGEMAALKGEWNKEKLELETIYALVKNQLFEANQNILNFEN